MTDLYRPGEPEVIAEMAADPAPARCAVCGRPLEKAGECVYCAFLWSVSDGQAVLEARKWMGLARD